MKQVDLYTKYREFVPDELHDLICPKPPDEIISKIKDHRRCTANKRLEKIKTMKNMKLIVDDDDNDEKDVAEKKDSKVVDDFDTDTSPKKGKNSDVRSLLV